MTKKFKTILEMEHDEAKIFFMEPSSYSTVTFPSYIDFSRVLSSSEKALELAPLNEQIDFSELRKSEDSSYILYANKDGNHSWRPFTLIHPWLYVDLVNTICEKKNWEKIKNVLLKSKSLKTIRCMSLPLKSLSDDNDTKATITNWWEQIEQKQIELALHYNTLLSTDITDCYGSIYTHSIAWAIEGKSIAKVNRSDDLLGNKIDKSIQNMRQGQTNGIPQGSKLMDLIAETVLAAVDVELEENIKALNLKHKYEILRYRDDYKIFTEDKLEAEKILKVLTETLMTWNFKLSDKKTKISENIIIDSIKKDKLHWNKYNSFFNSSNIKISIQKELLEVLKLSQEFPNSGSISKALINLYKRRINVLSILPDDYKQLISISTELMLNNPKVIETSVAIISKILSLIKNKTLEIKNIIEVVYAKVIAKSNSEFTEIWLDRLALPYKINIMSDSRICQKVHDDSVMVWDSSWIKGDSKNGKNEQKFGQDIINMDEISKLEKVIPVSEIDVFYY